MALPQIRARCDGLNLTGGTTVATATKGRKATREAGVRVVTILLDNEVEWEAPDGAEVLADGMLDLDNPDRTSTDKGYKVFYHPVADPNNPILVNAVLDKAVVNDVPLGGQLMLFISDKARDKAAQRQARK